MKNELGIWLVWQKEKLPADVGNEKGEPVVEERQVKPCPLPTVAARFRYVHRPIEWNSSARLGADHVSCIPGLLPRQDNPASTTLHPEFLGARPHTGLRSPQVGPLSGQRW